MKNASEFEVMLTMWVDNEKRQRDLADATIAYFLLREGLDYYYRSISKQLDVPWGQAPLKD